MKINLKTRGMRNCQQRKQRPGMYSKRKARLRLQKESKVLITPSVDGKVRCSH